MQIIIIVSKTHARILSSLLVIILLGTAADYASGAAGLTKWHPLSEISADNGATSIANTINVPSQGNVSITGNLSLKGAGNRIIFPDNSVLSSATGIGGGSSGGDWATSGLNIYNNTPGVNVGIGTASPGQKLQVEGNVQAQRIKFSGVGGDSGVGADYYAIYQESGAWVYPYPDLRIQYHTGIKYDAYQGYGGHQFYTGYDGTGNPSGLQMQITDKVYIAGNVGIGTTGPGAKLQVDTASTTGTGRAQLGIISNGWWGGQGVGNYFGGWATDTQPLLKVESWHGSDPRDKIFQVARSGDTPYLTVQGGGNVGIGTTAPGAKLDVQGGQIRFKGINLEYVTGSNPTCPAGTGGIVIRKWSQPSCTLACSCSLPIVWSLNPPSCQASTVINWGSCNPNNMGTCYSSTWSEAICMGN